MRFPRGRVSPQEGEAPAMSSETASIDGNTEGLAEADLPPAVRAALEGYRAEIDRLNRRLAEAELLADRDALTPALNRRAFVRELHRMIAFCERYEATASLVFFDLDSFKAVNDTFGHAAGDAALLWVAATLADHVRESDVVGRLGGDEFAVILAQASREAAETKAASLAAAIQTQPVIFEGQSIPIRASYGVRVFERGLEAAEMLAEADAAMFLRKGRR